MEVGTKVNKVKGYQFPGTIVAKFNTTKGDVRYVVEMENYGLLHIFNGEQLCKRSWPIETKKLIFKKVGKYKGYDIGSCEILTKIGEVEVPVIMKESDNNQEIGFFEFHPDVDNPYTTEQFLNGIMPSEDQMNYCMETMKFWEDFRNKTYGPNGPNGLNSSNLQE